MSKGRIDPEFIKWHHAIDTIYGLNHHTQDEVEGRRLMSLCKYPDAIWYTTWDGIAREGCVRSQCFDALGRKDMKAMIRVVKLRYIWAIGHMFWYTRNAIRVFATEISSLLVLGIVNNDPRCLYIAYHNNFGCLLCPDPLVAKMKLLRHAAKVGLIDACLFYARSHKAGSLRYCIWLEKAVKYGVGKNEFVDNVLCKTKTYSKKILYIIGRILFRSADPTLYQINKPMTYVALSTYDRNRDSTKLAVDAWSIVALRLGVNRDVRRLVGEAIWKTREAALY
jgi:hypothetical protein